MKATLEQFSMNNERNRSMRILQIGCVALVLLAPGFKIGGVTPPPAEHQSVMKARVVSLDGTEQTVTLEGAGCTESICSRVFLRGKDEKGATLQPLFGSLAAIKNTTHSDALFVMRNGSELRLNL